MVHGQYILAVKNKIFSKWHTASRTPSESNLFFKLIKKSYLLVSNFFIFMQIRIHKRSHAEVQGRFLCVLKVGVLCKTKGLNV